MESIKKHLNFEWGNFFGGGLLLYVGGLFFVIRGIVVVGIALSQIGWVAVPAIVIESETSQTYTQERWRTNFHFQYEYTFEDMRYTSRRVSAAQLSPSEIEGVERYNVGDPIEIFVNPLNPDQAVIDIRRPSIFVYFGLVLGLIFIGMGTGLTFFGDVGGLITIWDELRGA